MFVCMYICVGIGRTMVENLLVDLNRLEDKPSVLTAVAVQGSFRFWNRFGFEKQPSTRSQLEHYGQESVRLMMHMC